MITLPDHIEVQWAERTGYPSWKQPSNKKTYCGECGRDITDADQYEDEHYEFLCEDCLLFLHKKDFWNEV